MLSTNNLQNADVDIPLSVLAVQLTGVAGSGKSSLIDGSVAGRDGVASIHQRRSGVATEQPATYTGLLDPIRKAFAKANERQTQRCSAPIPKAPVRRAMAPASSTPIWG